MASSNSADIDPLSLIPRIHVDDTFGAFLLATCIGLSYATTPRLVALGTALILSFLLADCLG